MPLDVPEGGERTWALTAMALDPRLDGLLLVDASRSAALATAASLIRIRRQAEPGGRARRLVIGSTDSDDDLYTGLQLHARDGSSEVTAIDGPLVARPDETVLVVVVPDLAHVSLAGARAATTMLGGANAVVERHGRSHSWSTAGTRWIAACAAAEVGEISPHLLDRFCVRLPVDAAVDDPVARILDGLGETRSSTTEEPETVPIEWLGAARATPTTVVTDAAIRRAVDLHAKAVGIRRPLTLLRLARVTARMAGERTVTLEHVDHVAMLTGLLAAPMPAALAAPPGGGPPPSSVPPAATEQTNSAPDPGPAAVVESAGGSRPPGRPHVRSVAADPDAATVAAPVRVADQPTAFRVEAAALIETPAAYPEDSADPLREFAPLAHPPQPRSGPASARGTIIGADPARSLQDIAWFPTLRHAAVYQRFRSRDPASAGLRIAPTDLMAHRRVAEAEQLLILVLDHTCRRGWNWMPSLAPYLQQAYVGRSAVTVVEVGAADARTRLRAESSTMRSVLDPRLGAALHRAPGAASPLAHGLSLAQSAAERALRRGAGVIRSVDVVVVTDGLGNVPLDASLTDTTPSHVSDEGVADSLDAARALRELDHVRVVAAQPEHVPHREILLDLVRALSAERMLVPVVRTAS